MSTKESFPLRRRPRRKADLPQDLEERLAMVESALNDVFEALDPNLIDLQNQALDLGVRYASLTYERLTYSKRLALINKGFPGAYDDHLQQVLDVLESASKGRHYPLKYYLQFEGAEKIAQANERLEQNWEPEKADTLISRGNALILLSGYVPLFGPVPSFPQAAWLDPTYNPKLRS